jgi:hypothetical protein
MHTVSVMVVKPRGENPPPSLARDLHDGNGRLGRNPFHSIFYAYLQIPKCIARANASGSARAHTLRTLPTCNTLPNTYHHLWCANARESREWWGVEVGDPETSTSSFWWKVGSGWSEDTSWERLCEAADIEECRSLFFLLMSLSRVVICCCLGRLDRFFLVELLRFRSKGLVCRIRIRSLWVIK